jgi:hypothetical protein
MTRITIEIDPNDESARAWIANWLAKLLNSAYTDKMTTHISVTREEGHDSIIRTTKAAPGDEAT